MAQIFPRWTNRAVRPLTLFVVGSAALLVAAVTYFFSPEYTDVGYQPQQPVAFSHMLHVGNLEIDCRYCHTAVEVSPVASVPPTKVCMNCHRLVGRSLESLALVRESDETGEPLHWIRVHDLPDYAHFDHSLHLRAGVGCSTCHGDVASMERVGQVEPLSMSWCLECHRSPDRYLRRPSEITNTRWKPPNDQVQFAERAVERLELSPPIDCTGCHQ